MAEYIDRHVAIDAMTQSVCGDTWEVEKAIEAVRQLPAADVVPVVRCKDCKHHAYDEIFCCYWCEYPGRVRDTTPDGFCDKGEE